MCRSCHEEIDTRAEGHWPTEEGPGLQRYMGGAVQPASPQYSEGNLASQDWDKQYGPKEDQGGHFSVVINQDSATQRAKRSLAPVLSSCKYLSIAYLPKSCQSIISSFPQQSCGACSELPSCQLWMGMREILTSSHCWKKNKCESHTH